MKTASRIVVRPVRREDAAAIARIDASYRGETKESFWSDLVERHLRPRRRGGVRIGVVAEEGGEGVVGYVFAQVRAVEFGSGPCGWIYAVGVRPDRTRQGIGTLLLDEASARLRAAGVGVVRTLVRRDDIAGLTFFRSNGFAAGPYVELERPVAGGREGAR